MNFTKNDENLVKDGAVDVNGKTPEEINVIHNYFLAGEGYGISDEEYMGLIKEKIESLHIKEKALAKLGIDSSQVNEIEPVRFSGFNYNGNYLLKGRHSSKYEVTWIFFSDTQIYIYEYVFDMTSSSTSELTNEYFYKDITNFASIDETKETITTTTEGCGCMKKTKYIKGSIDNSYFSIIVPGDQFSCSMAFTPENESIIQGMKQKLREKKN